MHSRRTVYWTATTIIALSFVSGGLAYLARAEVPLRGMLELGYPAYFVTVLGLWKLLGGVAIVTPGLPRLKEWAYAGILFDLTGAAWSQAATGHPAKVVAPMVLLGVMALSWALRPADRSIALTTAATR